MTNKPIIGKYVLDTLSIGMYNHPLMLIREYIQNSVDAIDALSQKGIMDKKDGKVDVKIDWRTKSLTITDNGCGISVESAYSTLTDLGKSLKKSYLNRGFRGIGRLGGLGYCEHLSFRTKEMNEKFVSISTWDCNKLRQILNDSEHSLDIFGVLRNVTSFEQVQYEGNKQDHFFIVEMGNIHSSRDILLNVPEIKAYLSQVAPVPFDYNNFSFAGRIEKELISYIPKYETYQIIVNGENIYKPYKDDITISDKHKDKVKDIHFINFEGDKGQLAFAWVADLSLLGIIRGTTLLDGIRLRSGNIMIGDKYLLADFFRERRFNNYLMGEIHTIDNRLVPNSRRDDFEDNIAKEELHNCFIKKIGLPYSYVIRKESEKRAANRREENDALLIEKAIMIFNKGYYSEKQKDNILIELNKLKDSNGKENNDINLNEIINRVTNSKHFAMHLNGGITTQKKKLLSSVIDKIYNLSSNKNEAEKIIFSIVESFSCGSK